MSPASAARAPGAAVLADFAEFGGEHCETASLRKVLRADGVDISEPLLFGLGGGIGFWYQPSGPTGRFRSMTSTRNGPFPIFVSRLAAALGLPLSIRRTDDPDEAQQQLRAELAAGRPAVCYVDLYHLPYFQASRHFGGHAVVVFGVDEEQGKAWISDRCPQPLVISTAELAAARASQHHPFPPGHARLEAPWSAARLPDADGFRDAIRTCCAAMLQTELPNEGLAGLTAFSAGLARDVRTEPAEHVVERLVAAHIDFQYAGTGGNGFRNLYRDFLDAARQWVPDPALADAVGLIDEARAAWSAVIGLLINDWAPASRTLREAYRRREADLRAGTEESLRRAAEATATLPDLRAAAAAELPGHRDQLADELARGFRRLLAAERALLTVLQTI
jgi:hypothetical protein